MINILLDNEKYRTICDIGSIQCNWNVFFFKLKSLLIEFKICSIYKIIEKDIRILDIKFYINSGS